ncbi:hypothetical protein [Tindallia californiensis]|uniref:Uncharacterized protein n=1 Tax=Tindallia californiensis TaxID=159292 RepID=A0A1H3R186_9FIRM|nr:hypothetical protein [Tindallia californiensis]SDZ19071.1 hypothetical protein SAMN05192546_11163 [Tindallia californiensis]
MDVKKFKDGSRCIVEERNGEQIIHIRLGKELGFVKGLVLSDDTYILNMNCSLSAEVPQPKKLIHQLKSPDESCKV